MLNNIVQEMKAEIAQYNEEERREYETSVKNYRDYINTMDYAHSTRWTMHTIMVLKKERP